DVRNGNNLIITSFNSTNNQNLVCISVDDFIYCSASSLWQEDSWSSYSGNCYLSGCLDSLACEYNPLAWIDDGSCLTVYGCTDVTACNYDPLAQCDDGSCVLPDGCTDPTACNYDENALCDDGSCDLPDGCGDPLYEEYDPLVTCSDPTACITLITTGIETYNIDKITIYPNPSQDVFNVEFNSLSRQDLELRIINVIGEVIYTENLNEFVGAYTKQVDLSTYTNGVYFLQITTDNGVINNKLILQ
ncbi:MAG: T9SS type A sorting domain-containing protein, partial [Flavobacteriales bacterium]|nr:T9SS type A sorting domain-containing protein [Flavobacteriales bacterium]